MVRGEDNGRSGHAFRTGSRRPGRSVARGGAVSRSASRPSMRPSPSRWWLPLDNSGLVSAHRSTMVVAADKLKLLSFHAPRMANDPRSAGFRTDGDIARPDRGLHGR